MAWGGPLFSNFEKELNELPGCYRESEGAIFLAKEDEVALSAMQYFGHIPTARLGQSGPHDTPAAGTGDVGGLIP